MKIDEVLDISQLTFDIRNYVQEISAAIEIFASCKCSLSSNEVRKTNVINSGKLNFLMSIKEFCGGNVNHKYALFYISLSKTEFLLFSNDICRTNKIVASNYSIRQSSVQESCNRIGARLLKFIKKDGSTFDIGTPTMLPFSEADQGQPKVDKLWPVTFYSMKMMFGITPVEFGITILESSEQRLDQIYNSAVGVLTAQEDTSTENVQRVAQIPPVFTNHFTGELFTGEKLSMSFSSNQLSDVLGILGYGYDPLEIPDDKSSLLEHFSKVPWLKNVKIIEGPLPDEFRRARKTLLSVMNLERGAYVAITVLQQA